MKTVALKLAILAALGVTLSGCIIYEGPDRGNFHHHHDEWSHHDDKPAPDEKPAPVLDQSAASASASQSSQN